MEPIGLFVSVPVACFRMPRAREYFETFPCPPPSTVFGMLLSMVGETERQVHEGAELAISLLSEPAYSVVLRTLWRVKSKTSGLGMGTNRRPDFQELLTDIRLAIWIRRGANEKSEICLAERVQSALSNPSSVSRFGGLSLGESTHLVDSVSRLDEKYIEGNVLMCEEEGDMSLPIWPDHVGSDTGWNQFRLEKMNITGELPIKAWVPIQRERL